MSEEECFRCSKCKKMVKKVVRLHPGVREGTGPVRTVQLCSKCMESLDETDEPSKKKVLTAAESFELIAKGFKSWWNKHGYKFLTPDTDEDIDLQMEEEAHRLDMALEEVTAEHDKRRVMYGPYNSMHEGYAVIKEELDELWDEIKDKNTTTEKLRHEAVQVCSAALRFIVDFGGDEELY